MMTKKWMPAAALAVLLFAATSCDDWGRKDPPAGNQVNPTLENVAAYDFEAEEGIDPTVMTLTANPGGTAPEIVEDEIKGKVLDLSNGYVAMKNPFNRVTLQKAASFTFWMRQPLVVNTDEEGNETVEPQNLEGSLLQFENGSGNATLSINANGGISYLAADGEWRENDPSEYKTGFLSPGDWHYVALIIFNDGYELYVDGDRKVNKIVADFDCSKLVRFINNVPVMRISSPDNNSRWLVDDLKLYRNTITAKEISRPNLGGGGTGPVGPSADPVSPVYFNSFDAGMGGCTVKGAGEIKYVGGAYGNVFSNAMDGRRTNYLILPSDVLKQSSESQALTIGVWVNRGNETESGHYMWSPLFTAYGAENEAENSFPMLACQYRGVLQTNCGGTWTDYTDVQNVDGQNHVYHDATDWLADGAWHYYTVVFTPTTAKVYFDGKMVNAWEMDGNSGGGSAAGLLSGDNGLSHVCLGGNQAWNWGDPDPGFWFDDIAIYNQELSEDQINSIITLKKNAIYGNTFSNGAGDATLMGDGGFIDSSDPGFGKIFKNAQGGMRQNYLKLPMGAFSGVADTEEVTIAMWVSSKDAGDYYWNPLFTAYAEEPGGNGCPMFACQYRGVVSINTNGPDNSGDTWCDYGNDICDAGEVILYHGDRDWLADQKWHLYTATFTPTRTIVYFDGEIANSWTLDGTSRGQVCDVKALADMKCICVCGNQAWGWSDPDPGFGIDDVLIYNKVLSQNEIKQLMLLKR